MKPLDLTEEGDPVDCFKCGGDAFNCHHMVEYWDNIKRTIDPPYEVKVGGGTNISTLIQAINNAEKQGFKDGLARGIVAGGILSGVIYIILGL